MSQWGHDFRPEYRALTVLHERYAGVPRIALTATADALTRADIVERLQLEEARQFVSSFDRPNIRYTIVEKKDATTQLLRFIEREHEGDAGIVYCQSRKRVEDVAQTLRDAGINALPYHAGLDAAVRQKHQDRFLREDGIVMVATIAFGMGIDKPDVRFVAPPRHAQEHRGLLPGNRPRRPRRRARRRLDGLRPAGRGEPAPHDRREPGRRGVQAGDARQARRAAVAGRGQRLPARAAAGLLRRAEHALRQLRQLPARRRRCGTAPTPRASCSPPSTACSSKAASASAPATSWTSCAARRPRRSSSSATSASAPSASARSSARRSCAACCAS